MDDSGRWRCGSQLQDPRGGPPGKWGDHLIALLGFTELRVQTAVPTVPACSKVHDLDYASNGNSNTCLRCHGKNIKKHVESLYMSYSDMPKALLCPL